MKITQAGHLLYSRAKPLLEALEQTETELTLRQMQLKGPLRICIPSESGPVLLGSAIADFACQNPDLEISCITNLSGFESLRDDLDVAIIITRGQLDDSDYTRLSLNKRQRRCSCSRCIQTGVSCPRKQEHSLISYISD